MFGPKPKGTWDFACNSRVFLEKGVRYKIVKAFTDFDGDVHEVGETWTFLGSGFLPYDDGLSMFVSLDGEHEWQIRLQDRPDRQAHIIENLHVYIVKS
jgi:hypothetical protein